MKHIVFDIETIPQDEAKLLALAPEFTAPANLKDPEKIAAAIARKWLREQYGVEEATLYNQRGKVIAFAGTEAAVLQPEVPGPGVLRQIRAQQPVRSIESIPDRGLFLRVIVPVNVLTIAEDIRVLQLLQRVPAAVAQDARVVDQGWRDYQELTLARVGLKRIFGLTLTLAMLLTLFSSIALAFLLSERLSAPLSALAEATTRDSTRSGAATSSACSRSPSTR